MARMLFTILAIAGWSMADRALAVERQHVCGQCGSGPTAYGVSACSAPNGYGLAPGCCEFPQRLCKSPWATYCDEKARARAFWSQCGDRRGPCGRPQCRSCAVVATSGCSPEGCAAGSTAAPGVNPGGPTPAPQPVPTAPEAQPNRGGVEPAPVVPAPVVEPQAARTLPGVSGFGPRQIWQPSSEPMTLRPTNPWTR